MSPVLTLTFRKFKLMELHSANGYAGKRQSVWNVSVSFLAACSDIFVYKTVYQWSEGDGAGDS